MVNLIFLTKGNNNQDENIRCSLEAKLTAIAELEMLEPIAALHLALDAQLEVSRLKEAVRIKQIKRKD